MRLLVLGGSLGARVFADVVPAALAALPPGLRARLAVVQQCRAEDLDRVRAAYAAAGIEAELAPFFADVAARLGAAHLVIARAGASIGGGTGGRRTAGDPGAAAGCDRRPPERQRTRPGGRGRGVGDRRSPLFTPARLADSLARWLGGPARLAAAAAAAAAIARADAAARLADLVERLMRHDDVGAHAEFDSTGARA